MNPDPPQPTASPCLDQKHRPPEIRFGWGLLITLVACLLIAGFLGVIDTKSFRSSLIYSLSIGLSIFLASWTIQRLLDERASRWSYSLLAIPIGALVGVAAARLIESGGRSIARNPQDLLAPLVSAMVFGVAVSYYFKSRISAAETRAQLREETLRRVEHEQRLTEAELKLLQAQIEPHFLFNTLSNVLQLVEADPPAARRMLFNLTAYLRASLGRTRSGSTSLGEELELVRAYLEIQAVRMGPRLVWRIDCLPELLDLPLPPLLVQPLVENAVRHGLEPRSAGGEVLVRASRAEGQLVLEVKDTGVGLDDQRPAGIGLTNVRERVRGVSAGRGSMTIQPNAPHGLAIRIALPLPEKA